MFTVLNSLAHPFLGATLQLCWGQELSESRLGFEGGLRRGSPQTSVPRIVSLQSRQQGSVLEKWFRHWFFSSPLSQLAAPEG